MLTFAESGGGVGKGTATGVGETIDGAGELLYQLPQPRDQCHLCAAHFSHRRGLTVSVSTAVSHEQAETLFA